MTTTTKKPPIKELPTQTRDFQIRAAQVDSDSRTVELAFASEEPYQRWYGVEILDHTPGAVRLDRLNGGGALLMDHNTRDQVGVVEKAWIDAGRVARARVRFSRSARGEEVFQDVQDGIRSLVSVGYQVNRMLLESTDGDLETYRVVDWQPFEVSIVAVPADATVGIGREATASTQYPVLVERAGAHPPSQEIRTMDTTVTAPAAPAMPDLQVIASQAQTAERDRAKHIRAAGAQFGLNELAEHAINSGTSVEEFNRSLIGKLGESAKIKPAESPEIGLSAREQQRYSFTRLMAAMLFPNEREIVNAAAFEMECSSAARANRQVPPDREAAFTIPADMLRAQFGIDEQARGMIGRRDLTVGAPTGGGNFVATDLQSANFIELLRNSASVIGLGARVLTDLNGNLAIPSQTGGATSYWVTEGNAPTESQQTVGQVAMTPKTVGAFTDYTRRLLLQSSLSVEAFVRADLAAVLALAIDQAAISGPGTGGAPTGILSTAGIGAVVGGTNGLAPTYDHIVDLESAVSVANANVGSLAYLTNAKVRGKLRKTQQFSGTNGVPVWDRDGTLLGYRSEVSNQVPSNLTKGSASGVCSAIIYGNWADLVIGLWGGLDLMLDPYALSTSGGKRIIALQDCDVAVRHAASFAAMVDALTT
jgi:HK97 family phage major capsid protein